MWEEVLEQANSQLIAKKKCTLLEYQVLKKRIALAIRKLLVHLRENRATLNIGQKRHLETVLVGLNVVKLRAAQDCLKIPVTAKGLGLRPRKQPAAQPPSSHRRRRQLQSDRVEWLELETAFKGRVRTGVVVNKVHKSPRNFLGDAVSMVVKRLSNCLRESMPSLKVNFVFCGEFERVSNDAELVELKYFTTPNVVITRGDGNIKASLETLSVNILTKVCTFS